MSLEQDVLSKIKVKTPTYLGGCDELVNMFVLTHCSEFILCFQVFLAEKEQSGELALTPLSPL